MTKDEFVNQVLSLRETLHKVSYGILPNRFDQEDAVQECIRIALQKRETLQHAEYLKTWIVRILINECYKLRRKKQREVPLEGIQIIIPPSGDGEMIEALMMLDEKLRLPLVLNHIVGYTVREIAHIVKAPESTVKSRMKKGRLLLQKKLEIKEELV